MNGHQTARLSFIQQMDAQLLQYQLEKIYKNQLKPPGQHFKQEQNAKQALIDLDNETDLTQNNEEQYIGRWEHYKVPEKVQQRFSLNKRTKPQQTIQNRYQTERQSLNYNNYCRSQKTIPKLKCILHQLEAPLDLPGRQRMRRASETALKMKNHIGTQALVISNKLQIQSAAKSQRKILISSEPIQNSQNRRPPSNHSHSKGQGASSYQKIKRTFGFSSDRQLLHQKQILSQLLKGNTSKQTVQISPLRNMLNFFTLAQNDKKKRPTTSKLGLDKLLC